MRYLSGPTSSLGLAAFGSFISGSTFGFVPSTDDTTAQGLPGAEAFALGNMAENYGAADGVSPFRGAPNPTATLITLAAAGRNPTDITIPTIGSEGSGGGGDDDAIVGGTSSSSTSNSSSATVSTASESGSGTGAASAGGSSGDSVGADTAEVDDEPGTHEVPLQSGVGHHYGPAAVINDPAIAPHLNEKAKLLVAGTYSGPTIPKHGYSKEHVAYNARVKEELVKFIAAQGGGTLDESLINEFLGNIRQGLTATGEVDEGLGAFIREVEAQAQAYRAATGARTSSATLSVEERIALGERYVRANPRRFPGLRLANALAPVSVVVGVLADSKNAPISGAMPGAVVVYGTYTFRDAGGRFYASQKGGFWPFKSPTYEKVYIDANGKTLRVEAITAEQYAGFEADGELFYGKMEFDWVNWERRFVPGMFRDSLPTNPAVKMYDQRGNVTIVPLT